jgi:hypothetical protein
MPKYTYTPMQGQFASVNELNSRFVAVQNLVNNELLSRANPTASANQMTVDLDMNGFTLLNVGSNTAGSGLVTWDDLQELSDTIQYSPILGDIANSSVIDLTASRSAVLTDIFGYVRSTSASAITFTIEPDSTTDFRLGAEITVRQQGAGLITLAAGSGVTINLPVNGTLFLGGEGATVTLKKAAANEWDLMGQVLAAS